MFIKNAMLQAIMSAEALSLAGASFTWTRVMQEPCKMSLIDAVVGWQVI
jgi:hypothetical protein